MAKNALRQPNPYRPGFNQSPMVFAGRLDVLDGAGEALEVAAYDARTPRPLILLGPRGVGKTVTLGEIANLAADELSWPTVHVEAKADGFLEELIRRLHDATQVLEGTAPRPPTRRRTKITGGKLEAAAFGVGGGVELNTSGTEPDSDLASALTETMRAATDRQAGLLLTLDELQNATPADRTVLGGTLQETVPRDWPLVVAVAALPSLRSSRGAHKLPTYLERAEWHELDALPAEDARHALEDPARQAGRPLTTAATDALLERVGGYPYAIQVAGHFAWRASHGQDEITLDHARLAAPRIDADLEQLFKGRWDDASPREQDYLRALAAATLHSDPPTGSQVAAELGEPPKAVSYLRERLLKKGTIYRDGSDRLYFITPGMASWVRTAHPGDR